MSRRVTIWQCTDWCCEDKPHARRWWNVGTAPGNYDSVDSWHAAVALALYRKLSRTS